MSTYKMFPSHDLFSVFVRYINWLNYNNMGFIDQAVIDSDKMDKVILSCKTWEHLVSAHKYVLLWEKKYHGLVNGVKPNAGFAYRLGKAVGLLLGMKKFIKP